MNRFISNYPGCVVKEGDTVNFKQFYATHAIQNNKDLSKFDTTLVEKIKNAIEKDDKQLQREVTDVDPHHKKEHCHHHNVVEVGTVFPKLLQSKNKKVLQ